jgi:hypothetical protein
LGFMCNEKSGNTELPTFFPPQCIVFLLWSFSAQTQHFTDKANSCCRAVDVVLRKFGVLCLCLEFGFSFLRKFRSIFCIQI